MHAVPDLPSPDAAPDACFEDGHLWLSEWLTGPLVRATLDESGQIRVAGAHGRIDDRDPPATLRWPIRALRGTLDRTALRRATDDPSTITLVLVAPRNEGVDYDWASLPPIVGVAIHDGARDRWLPPDAAERAFEGIGLATLPTVARERRARDIDCDAIELPDSAYRAGPAAGVLIQNKRGDRVLVRADASDSPPGDITREDVDSVAEQLITADRLDGAVAMASDRSTVADRLLEIVLREEWPTIDGHIEITALRSALGACVAETLAERDSSLDT